MTRVPHVTGFARPEAEGQSPKAAGRALRERVPRVGAGGAAGRGRTARRGRGGGAVQCRTPGGADPDTGRADGREPLRLPPRIRRLDGLRPGGRPGDGRGCADLRRRARRQFRPLRRCPRRTRHGPQRLRRNPERPVGVGREAARCVAGAGGPGSGRRRGQVPEGGAGCRGRLSAHDAAAGEAARHRVVERHRRRGVGLPHRRQGPVGHLGAGGAEGAQEHQRQIRGEGDRGSAGRRTAIRGRSTGAAADTG